MMDPEIIASMVQQHLTQHRVWQTFSGMHKVSNLAHGDDLIGGGLGIAELLRYLIEDEVTRQNSPDHRQVAHGSCKRSLHHFQSYCLAHLGAICCTRCTHPHINSLQQNRHHTCCSHNQCAQVVKL